MAKDSILTQKNSVATFVVTVKSKENATWQGTVTWAEENRVEHFRSVLELIRLLNSAVEATDMTRPKR